MAPITLYEKLSLVFNAFGVVPYTLLAVLRTFSLQQGRIAITRYITGAATIRQLQYVVPPSVIPYMRWMKSKKLRVNIEELPALGEDEVLARLLWIGEEWKEGMKMLLYFHGGGYVMPMMEVHLELVAMFKKVAQGMGVDKMAVAVLEYNNSPDHKYPHQLSQASRVFSSLIHRGVPPSSIVIGGDSAGGHLALSLVSHILHPHANIRAVPALSSPLAGLALISPATTFKATAASFQRNDGKDVLNHGICTLWTRQFYDGSPYWADFEAGGYWGEAVKAPAGWWDGIATVTSRCLVTTGDREVLVDDILELMATFAGLREDWALETLVGKGELHDAPFIDFLHHGKAVSETTFKVAEFVGAALKPAAG